MIGKPFIDACGIGYAVGARIFDGGGTARLEASIPARPSLLRQNFSDEAPVHELVTGNVIRNF